MNQISKLNPKCDYIKGSWKILPSYEELRRGAIGKGNKTDLMSSRFDVNLERAPEGCVGSGWFGALRMWVHLVGFTTEKLQGLKVRSCAKCCVSQQKRVQVGAKVRGFGRAVAGYARASLQYGRSVQRSRTGQQCVEYYWGMQLQTARRIGRRVQRSRKGKQCAAYYQGMPLQIPRRIGRRRQRSRKGKQCAAYYWGMQLQIARRLIRWGEGCAGLQVVAPCYRGMQLQIADVSKKVKRK